MTPIDLFAFVIVSLLIVPLTLAFLARGWHEAKTSIHGSLGWFMSATLVGPVGGAVLFIIIINGTTNPLNS